MRQNLMERLFGGAPRPPYGLEISTRTEEVYAYLREVSDLVAEGAVEEVGRLLEDHSVGIDDSQSILGSVKLLFEDLVFRIKTGGPDSPEVPVVRQPVTLEVVDDEIAIADLVRLNGEVQTRYAFSVGQWQCLREALETVFVYELLSNEALPRIVTFE